MSVQIDTNLADLEQLDEVLCHLFVVDIGIVNDYAQISVCGKRTLEECKPHPSFSSALWDAFKNATYCPACGLRICPECNS